MEKTRVALVGAGRMGKNHLRVLRESASFELVAVVDVAAPEPRELGGAVFRRSISELAGLEFDAAIVATPTASHFAVGNELVAMGKHVLIEKPLASSYEQGRALITAARAKGVKLAVGHVERFNPALGKLREVIKEGWLGTPIHFSFTRVGGYPQTVLRDNNVLLDLAVHDLDVLRTMVGAVRIERSMCHASWREGVLDTAEILLSAAGGPSANVHVNWITPTKIRSIRVTGTRGVCFVDYILQTCELFGGSLLKAKEPVSASFVDLQNLYRSTDRIQFGVQRIEPLVAEIEQFARFLAGEDPGDLCTASDALAAVILALQAVRAVDRARPASKNDPEALPQPEDDWV